MRGLALAMVCLFGCGNKSEAPRATKSGGIAITYSLDLDIAVVDRAREIQRDFQQLFADQHIVGTTTVSQDGTIAIVVKDLAHRSSVEENLRSYTDTIERTACPADVDERGTCVRVARSYVPTLRKAALDQAVRVIRERLAARKIDDVDVHAQAENIVVELPALDQDKLASIQRVISRGGRLEFVVVDSGSKFMEELYRRVATDPAARDAEIKGDIDAWRSDDGARRVDYYLTAHDQHAVLGPDDAKRYHCFGGAPGADGKVDCTLTGRAVLERYLSSVAVPPDRRIGFEIVEPLPDARDRRPFARTYLLEARARLTGVGVANATKSFDPNTNRPVVLLDFNRFGGRMFADVTTEIAGGKLAIVLDDRITSAPIITGPIRGGRASITMGGSDAERIEEDADELATVLRTGSLPSPLREETIRPR